MNGVEMQPAHEARDRFVPEAAMEVPTETAMEVPMEAAVGIVARESVTPQRRRGDLVQPLARLPRARVEPLQVRRAAGRLFLRRRRWWCRQVVVEHVPSKVHSLARPARPRARYVTCCGRRAAHLRTLALLSAASLGCSTVLPL